MIRDAFYFGKKPNAHPREKPAKNLIDARNQSTTEHFWIINEYCNYSNLDWDFDFDFLPDDSVWQSEHNNVWPSIHQRDSGTWLCAKDYSGYIVYRTDVEPLKTYENVDNWNCLDKIDKTKFDFTWHPDPSDPPYIYRWGCKYYPAELKPVLEYVVPGATEIKYMPNIVQLEPNYEYIKEIQNVDRSKFDLSWRPSPLEQPYIYVWGNKHIEGKIKSTLEYHVPEAMQVKYMEDLLPVIPDWELWHEKVPVDKTKFDFTWRPDPREPPYIYVFGNYWNSPEKEHTLEYHTPGATDYKYIKDVVAHTLPDKSKFKILHPIDESTFDFSWRPDPGDPPYIYVFGNQWYDPIKMPTILFEVQGATDYKYVTEITAKLLPNKSKWFVPDNIDDRHFDYSWVPDPTDPPYIYQFGTQWQKTGGPKYVVKNATEIKFIDFLKVKNLPCQEKFEILDDNVIKDFDYSWHPDDTSPPYIYIFGNNLYSAEIMPTIRYVVEGAKDIKYNNTVVALLGPNKNNWVIPDNLDVSNFDFTWKPNPKDPPYIYQFGTQHQKTGGPCYIVENAKEKKYIEGSKAIIYPASDKSNWEILHPINMDLFDFSWHPDDSELPYNYVFGNEQYPSNIMPTVRYNMHGATQEKFINEIAAKLLANKKGWKFLLPVDKNSFDFSWVPNPKDPAYIYVFGNQWNTASREPTLEYAVKGATEKKYITEKFIKVLPDKSKFEILYPIIEEEFDFSWRPDPYDPPYIYVFGNNRYSAELMPTVRYVVEGATQIKFVSTIIARLAPNMTNWHEIIPINKDNFDYSWVPDPNDPPYIYVFGNQWNSAEIESTMEYHVPGATEKKYISEIIAQVAPTKKNWKQMIPVENFDYSWRPNPHSPPYIYVFGNQWNDAATEPTLEYQVDGATDRKYITDIIAKVSPTTKNYNQLISVKSFDYSWRPNPHSPPYIYVFGNEWNDAATEPTLEYKVNGATEYKYMDFPIAETNIIYENWIKSNSDYYHSFNYSWRPNPHSPPQIYQWEDNGPRYTVPGATEVVLMKYEERHKKTVDDTGVNSTKTINVYQITTTLENLIKQHPEEVFWAINPNLNYSEFDFSWRPNAENFRHINVFGNEYTIDTQTYFINAPLYLLGYRDYNYIQSDKIKLDSKLSMVFIDRGNKESKERYDNLKERYPQLIKTRYLNSWVDTITRCINKADTDIFWVLNSELDYTDFKFDFYPSPWQIKMLHIFGTQWNHWGTTYLINKETFLKESQYVKIMEHLGSLNFVKNKTAIATNCLYDIYLIDHGNDDTTKIYERLKCKASEKSVHIVKFDKSYLNTFKNIVNQLQPTKETFIWISNSICDYDKFDFSFICDPYAKENLHVFATDFQKLGDTFLVNVNYLKSKIDELNELNQYEKINYVNFPKTKRLPAPVIISQDTHIDTIKQSDYKFPYAIFKTQDNQELTVTYNKPLCLWEESRTVEILSTGGSAIVVPKEVKNNIKNQVYDYPKISKAEILLKSKPLDIVFLSNGEPLAEKHYEYLQSLGKHIQNRIVRVDGVNGRVAAYHAAASASNTPWFFTVFAKLEVDLGFNFAWQPDRLQNDKHYIFHALNPVNGLVYGHQAMIAYNKKLVLNNLGRGLDFTLDDPHETVEILSGTAKFDTDAYSTWRTAFREVIKLKSDYTDIAAERLNIWLKKAKGKFAKDCLNGANDAVEYYAEVKGDIEKLKFSYEWDWLKEYYNRKYK